MGWLKPSLCAATVSLSPSSLTSSGIPRNRMGGQVVAEPLEDLLKLSLREQEEQQHGVGLLCQLVAVGVVALGAQDPVEPLDVAVLGAVGVPVELLEVLVTLELADYAVVVERHEHPFTHLPPGLYLFVGEPEPGAQRPATPLGEQLEHLLDRLTDPSYHHVGVGVVPQALLF